MNVLNQPYQFFEWIELWKNAFTNWNNAHNGYGDLNEINAATIDDVRSFFKEKVFRTVIPRNVRLGEAPSHGMPVILYDVKSRGAEAYLALAREVIERSAPTVV